MGSKTAVLIWRWGPMVAVMGAIFYLSSQPWLPEIPVLGGVDWGDKIEHSLAYFVLGAMVWRAMRRAHPRVRLTWLVILIASVYGLSDEIHQRFVPGRTCDMLDLGADSLGSALAAAILSILLGGNERWQTNRNKRRLTK